MRNAIFRWYFSFLNLLGKFENPKVKMWRFECFFFCDTVEMQKKNEVLRLEHLNGQKCNRKNSIGFFLVFVALWLLMKNSQLNAIMVK
jgi:hypothetical protein